MVIQLKKESYEKLVKQLIFIDENKDEIKEELLNKKIFLSKSVAQNFLKGYVNAIESIFANISVVDNDLFLIDKNQMPFIIINSNFTLVDKNNLNYYCHLTTDIYEQASGIIINIYAFSELGIELLLKEKGTACNLNLGNEICEYRINSISMS